MTSALSRHRILQELAIETTHRDSRYSDALVDLMKREELASQDNINSHQCKELSSKVDEALKVETQKFFAKTAQQNIKKWHALLQKLEREMNSKSSPKPILTDLELERLRLEEDYNRHWFQYEGFHLNAAFESQTARVDSEWLIHENALAEDFESRKCQLLGTTARGRSSNAAADSSDAARWQHAEKQKTLIHTAPVMSPTAKKDGNSNSNSNSSNHYIHKIFGGSKDQQANNNELVKLEKRYQAALESLQRQKSAAKRWINRQKVRMVAQATEVHEERQHIAAIILYEYQTLSHRP